MHQAGGHETHSECNQMNVNPQKLFKNASCWEIKSTIRHCLFCCVTCTPQCGVRFSVGGRKLILIWFFHLCALPPAETQVCFRYYHGVTGALRATTPSVTIKNGCATVSLTTLHCFILTHEMCGASLVPQLPSFFIPVHFSQLCQSALVVRKHICNYSLPGYKLVLK